MKKAIVGIGLGIFGLIVLVESHILEALLSFFLAGVIPGTPYTLPSSMMLVILVCIAWLTIFRLTAAEPSTPPKKRSTATTKRQLPGKKRAPKRRYKQAYDQA